MSSTKKLVLDTLADARNDLAHLLDLSEAREHYLFVIRVYEYVVDNTE